MSVRDTAVRPNCAGLSAVVAADSCEACKWRSCSASSVACLLMLSLSCVYLCWLRCTACAVPARLYAGALHGLQVIKPALMLKECCLPSLLWMTTWVGVDRVECGALESVLIGHKQVADCHGLARVWRNLWKHPTSYQAAW